MALLVLAIYHLLVMLADAMQSQVLAGSSEQLTAAEKEVTVMTQLHHPNLLPRLEHAVAPDPSPARMLQLVYMLFPVYEAGTLPSP